MKIEKKDGTIERQILIGMITNRTVLAGVCSEWERDLFGSKWSNIISKMCRQYFDKHGEPPGKNIHPMFERWAARSKDESTIKSMEMLFEYLSEEYRQSEEANADYILDQARIHFNEVRARRLADDIDNDLTNNDVDKALEKVEQFRKSSVNMGKWISVLEDMEAWRKAYDNKTINLIKYPGDLGRFFGQSLGRDSFIGLQAPEKYGKSFWLYDMAWRALLQKRRVAYFVIGDMSEHQVMKRIGSRATGHPYIIPGGFPGEIHIPTAIRVTEEGVQTKTKTRSYSKQITWKIAWKGIQKISERANKENLRLSCHPALEASVSDLKALMKQWESSGWGVPDVVVFDYADNLRSESLSNEYRHQVNHIWKSMRALAQDLHCLVLTATQADMGAVDNEMQSRQNFSEDKRKFAEVTGMIAVSATHAEMRKGVSRLNWLALRDDAYITNRQVYVAGCLPISSPAIKSCWSKPKKSEK